MYKDLYRSDMGEKKRVNLRVNASTKEKWDTYVEESDEYETLSRLIRTVVNAEIASDMSDGERNEGNQETHDLSSEDEFDRLDNRLDEMKSAIDNIQDEITTEDGRNPFSNTIESPNPEINMPKEKVFDMLPEGKGADDGETVASMKEGTGFSEWVIQETANILYHNSGRVKRYDNGETVYWKEV